MTTDVWCAQGRGYVTYPSVVDEGGAHHVNLAHLAQHRAFCATTPHHAWQLEAAPTPGAPPPAVRPARFDPEHPSVPSHVRGAYRKAQRAGWEVVMGYSQVPKKRVDPVRYEQTHTLSVIARRPGTWVAMFWSFEKGKWAADGANIGMHAATHKQVKEVLDGLGS